jgi:hypothetical protein
MNEWRKTKGNENKRYKRKKKEKRGEMWNGTGRGKVIFEIKIMLEIRSSVGEREYCCQKAGNIIFNTWDSCV